MVLVLFLLGTFIIALFLTIIILLSEIQIEIKDLNINEKEKLKDDYKIIMYIKLFGIIKIFKKNLESKQIKKIHSKGRLKQEKIKKVKEKMNIKLFDILKSILNLKIKFSYLDLLVNLGTEDAVITSYIVALIGSALGILLPHIVKNENINNCNYKINSLYTGKKEYNISFNCIFNIKIVHIIYVIYILIQKGRDKNEQSSNRGSYAYSNE